MMKRILLLGCFTSSLFLGTVGEGVYGLQRAFKMAGVDIIIMSLWKVPDNETAEFMSLFYKKWMQNKLTIRKAFQETQLFMQNNYQNEPEK